MIQHQQRRKARRVLRHRPPRRRVARLVLQLRHPPAPLLVQLLRQFPALHQLALQQRGVGA